MVVLGRIRIVRAEASLVVVYHSTAPSDSHAVGLGDLDRFVAPGEGVGASYVAGEFATVLFFQSACFASTLPALASIALSFAVRTRRTAFRLETSSLESVVA